MYFYLQLVKIYLKFKWWMLTKEGRLQMGKLFEFLNGKKTYIGAVAYGLYAIVQFSQDQSIENLGKNLWIAYMIWAGKSAISKLEVK